ncbi:MAG TPA: hypothetical protein DDX04_12090 [Massilia sp.]|nr:hypothetical protein [Massilia sp.]
MFALEPDLELLGTDRLARGAQLHGQCRAPRQRFLHRLGHRIEQLLVGHQPHPRIVDLDGLHGLGLARAGRPEGEQEYKQGEQSAHDGSVGFPITPCFHACPKNSISGAADVGLPAQFVA